MMGFSPISVSEVAPILSRKICEDDAGRLECHDVWQLLPHAQEVFALRFALKSTPGAQNDLRNRAEDEDGRIAQRVPERLLVQYPVS